MLGVLGPALTHNGPPIIWACGQGPLPTGCSCGGCGRGDLSPAARRALLRPGFARCCGSLRAPWGEALVAWVWGVRGWALTTPNCLSLGRAAGARYPLAAAAEGVAVGTRHQSHSARSCELAFRAVGAARRCPGGGVPGPGVGRPGLGAHPCQTARPWGVRPEPATHWLRVRGMWAWGTVTNPTARALVSWLCALRGRHRGAQGGASLALVWVDRGSALTHARGR